MVGNHVQELKSLRTKLLRRLNRQSSISCLAHGISREGEILDLAAECNVVNKSGAWYSYNGEQVSARDVRMSRFS